MTTYKESLSTFKKEMDELGISYHEEIYHAIFDHMGPSLHKGDSSLVACSDPAERDAIKKDFLMKELGMTDEAEMDHAIEQVCGNLGQSNRNKHTATFYYLLVAFLGREAHFHKA